VSAKLCTKARGKESLLAGGLQGQEEAFGQPLQVAALLAGFARPWFVVGGWAVDLYSGRVTRPHHDVEIAIFREDQLALQDFLSGWEFQKATRNPEKPLEPWHQGEWLELPVHEIHAQPSGAEPSELEVLLNERRGEEWVFRRNQSVTRPLAKVAMQSALGIPFLSPEVVLLYKAKAPRAHDIADFEELRGLLDQERRSWLKWAIAACHPDHPWLGVP